MFMVSIKLRETLRAEEQEKAQDTSLLLQWNPNGDAESGSASPGAKAPQQRTVKAASSTELRSDSKVSLPLAALHASAS